MKTFLGDAPNVGQILAHQGAKELATGQTSNHLWIITQCAHVRSLKSIDELNKHNFHIMTVNLRLDSF